MDYFPCRYGINSSWENSRISRRPLLSIESISTLYVLPVNCLMASGQPNPHYVPWWDGHLGADMHNADNDPNDPGVSGDADTDLFPLKEL